MKRVALFFASAILLLSQSRPLDEHLAHETTDVRIKTFEKLLAAAPGYSKTAD